MMPWYIHAYHVAWLLLLIALTVFFGMWAGLALLCGIAWYAFFYA